MLLALTLLALCSVKASAQSPPCSRKPSPAATRPRAFFRLRASPANTSGGNVESRCSTAASAVLSGYSGIWATGLLRQLSRVQRSGMRASATLKPRYGRDFPVPGPYTRGPAAQARCNCARQARGADRDATLFGRLAPTAQGLFPQRHQFLRGSRMHRDDGVDVGLGRLHLQRDTNELDHLARVGPHDVAADELIALAVDDELEEGARIAARKCHLQRAK